MAREQLARMEPHSDRERIERRLAQTREMMDLLQNDAAFPLEVVPYENRLRYADESLQELRWMIEELRVSLFAQQLGTRQSVSPKKVEQRLRALADR